MQTVQLQVEDNSLEAFLTVIKSLKPDMVKNVKVKNNIKNVSDEEQTYYSNLLHSMTSDDKQISSKETVSI